MLATQLIVNKALDSYLEGRLNGSVQARTRQQNGRNSPTTASISRQVSPKPATSGKQCSTKGAAQRHSSFFPS
jgi:hypothetical protein